MIVNYQRVEKLTLGYCQKHGVAMDAGKPAGKWTKEVLKACNLYFDPKENSSLSMEQKTALISFIHGVAAEHIQSYEEAKKRASKLEKEQPKDEEPDKPAKPAEKAKKS